MVDTFGTIPVTSLPKIHCKTDEQIIKSTLIHLKGKNKIKNKKNYDSESSRHALGSCYYSESKMLKRFKQKNCINN